MTPSFFALLATFNRRFHLNGLVHYDAVADSKVREWQWLRGRRVES